MKVVIPLAGLGTRMRPQTHSKPKPMIRIAGKPILGHLLEWVVTDQVDEVILIVSPQQQDVGTYARGATDRPVRIVVQSAPRGQAHAVDLVRELVTGPLLILFSDTLADTSFQELSEIRSDGVVYVKEVADPSRFGVVVAEDRRIVDIVEKPRQPVSNLAVIGMYFFPECAPLFDAIARVLAGPPSLNGEYFIADALQVMIRDGRWLEPRVVGIWEDTGAPEYTLHAQRFLLDRSGSTCRAYPGVSVIPPVYVSDDATVSQSVIGPYVSIESGCRVERAVLSDCILDEGAHVQDSVLSRGLIGRRARVVGSPLSLNLGDDSTIFPSPEGALPRL